MKLQQLRYIAEVNKHDLNVSQTAQALFTSQPGISRHIRQLEEELGIEIFARSGKHLSGITAAGEAILAATESVLQGIENIKSVADEHATKAEGALSVATTHTQCRYVLPPVINRFIVRYPSVALHMHQGTPMQISQLAADGTADIAIATEAMEYFSDLVMLPCYRWNRTVLVPKTHILAKENALTISKLSEFPLVTYTFGFTGRSKLDEAFSAEGLSPKVVFTAADADVIKTYVRLGLGVGIVAKMAFDPELDSDLVALDASHLFDPSITRVGIKRNKHLRGYMHDFIEMFAPHLDPDLVARALTIPDPEARNRLFDGITIPEFGAGTIG